MRRTAAAPLNGFIQQCRASLCAAEAGALHWRLSLLYLRAAERSRLSLHTHTTYAARLLPTIIAPPPSAPHCTFCAARTRHCLPLGAALDALTSSRIRLSTARA